MVATGKEFTRSVGWRLFVTVWLVYSIFATTNVVRETYLAVSLSERRSVRVDPYRELHPDLFEVPGRGWYINSNPGASVIGAVAHGLFVRPVIAVATRLRPGIAAPKPPATYDDPRPARQEFLNASRARGLDIVLGLAALGTAATLMAPLGALSAVLVFLYLGERLGDSRRALAWSLIFAFATPMLFRAAFLNQNAMVAHLVLGAWILKVGLSPRPTSAAIGARTLAIIGVMLGFAMVCDFSAIPFVVVFGLWIMVDAWRRGGPGVAVRDAAIYGAGVACSLSILFAYQWIAFGHPLLPAQRYMPPTQFSVKGWFGFTAPAPELLLGNLFDPRYGLFTYCPLLLAALAAPWIKKASGWMPSRDEHLWIFLGFAGLLLFSSANQFANLQWNTGVRYMVPAAPLLFFAAIPVLNALPRVLRWTLIGASIAITFAVSMTREDVPTALRLLVAEGPSLPILIVLRKTAGGYDVSLPAASFWIIAAVVTIVLFIIWRPVRQRAAVA